MIRLTIVSQSREEVVLKVEGWVSGTDVAVLEMESYRLFEETQHLVLDLEDVKFIDWEGLALLKRWSGDRLELRGASMFLHERLTEYGLL